MDASAIQKIRNEYKGKVLYDLTVHMPDLQDNDENESGVKATLLDQYPIRIQAKVTACEVIDITDTGTLSCRRLGPMTAEDIGGRTFVCSTSFLYTKEECLEELDSVRVDALMNLEREILALAGMAERIPTLRNSGVENIAGSILKSIQQAPDDFVRVQTPVFPAAVVENKSKSPSMKM